MKAKQTVIVLGAACLALVLSAGVICGGGGWNAMLISGALGNSSTGDLTNLLNSVNHLQGYLQEAAIGGAPLALAGAGIAWGAGSRRGFGLALTTIAGLVLAILAGPIAN